MPIASRRERIFSRYPDLVSGYELNPEHGYFSVIIPEATTNLCTNPSLESAATGWAALGGAIAIVATWQAYGVAGLEVTPAALTESGAYWGDVTLANGSTYTASITIQGEAGKIYYIWFASNAGALIGTKRQWIGTGHKQTIHVTHRETAGAARRVYITRDAKYGDVNKFYVDGLQVEAKSYPTTYCDGSQLGFVIGEVAYYWNGTQHASTSTRSAQTRAGGREVNLLDYGFRVLSVIGLGMAMLVDQALAIPGFGEMAQGTGTQAREFTLVGALASDTDNPRYLMSMRDDLIDAFKPDLVTNEQPLVLGFQAQDEDGEALGEKVQIVAKYRGGLEGNWDNHQGERLALNFKQYVPYIQSAWDSGVELGFQTDVPNADYIIMRDSTGLWQEMAGGTNGTINEIVKAQNGNIYIGGAFALAGGVANTVKIAYWNGTAWAPLLNGITAGNVYALAFDANGNLYVGGNFTNQGDANGDGIVMWDGTAWSSLGTGVAVGGQVECIAIGPDGNVYAGGTFTSMGGVANTVGIAMWDGAAWNAVGLGVTDGVGGSVYDVAVDKAGNLYAGGSFLEMGGIANTRLLAKWDGTAWSRIGNASFSAGSVYGLAIGTEGSIYICGDFTRVVSIGDNMAYIARWNGASWQSLNAGMNAICYNVFVDNDGILYAGGSFTTVTGIPILPDRIAMYNGSSWMPLDINLPGAPILWAFLKDDLDNFYIGFTTSGNATSATVRVPAVGSAKVFPILYWLGPGTLYQVKNYTTGKAIYFNNLTLLAGEYAWLILDPMNLQFWSSFRGNLRNYILQGSNTNFELLPGNNNISTFIYGSTDANSGVVMAWRESYWSLDGTIWK